MITQKLILFIIIVFALSVKINSQSPDSLVSEGLKNNPGIKALEKNIKAAEYGSRSEGYLPPPTLGVEFSQVPFEDPDPLKNSLSQNLIFSQMFMTGGKLSAMEEAELKRAGIVKTDLDAYKLKLTENIRKSYYDIWMMEHHIAIREDNIEFLQNISKSAEQYYQVNRTSYSEMVLIKAEIVSARTKIVVMQNELNSMYVMMNSLLGRPDLNAEIIVQHNWEPDTTSLDIPFIEKSVLEKNPSLTKMDRMTEMNQLEINANNKELYPDLMIQGMVMRMPQGMILTSKTPVHALSEPGSTEYMYSIMASVTLPFMPWSSGKYRNKEQELLTSIEGLALEKKNMEYMLQSQFSSLANTIKSTKREMELLKKDVIPLYRQTLESQLSEFRNNRNSIINIIQTLNMLLMKEEELAEVITKHQKTLAEIESLSAVSLNDKGEENEK